MSEDPPPLGPSHIESDRSSDSPPTKNPLGDQFNITLSIPETIEIKMVDAHALGDYELLGVVVSILASALIGFFVAYRQAAGANATDTSDLGWFCVVLLLLFAAAVFAAWRKRTSIRKKGRNIRLQISGAAEAPKAAAQ